MRSFTCRGSESSPMILAEKLCYGFSLNCLLSWPCFQVFCHVSSQGIALNIITKRPELEKYCHQERRIGKTSSPRLLPLADAKRLRERWNCMEMEVVQTKLRLTLTTISSPLVRTMHAQGGIVHGTMVTLGNISSLPGLPASHTCMFITTVSKLVQLFRLCPV